MKWLIYFSAAIYILWPLSAMSSVWMSDSATSGAFLFTTLIFVWFISIARWDVTSRYLPFVFSAAYVALTFYKFGWIPAALTLLVIIVVYWFPRRAPRGEQFVALRSPFESGRFFVAQGGNTKLLNHHRHSRSQRYALDISKVNFLGVRARGIYPQDLRSYCIFASPVIAPCDGVITAVVDGHPDLPRGEMDRANPAGNHVVIRCSDSPGVYVGLAHLMQGSIVVQPGQTVKSGERIACVGNSGNTTEPHLHIHAKRGGNAESMLDGEGVPMRIDSRWLTRGSTF